MPLKGCSDACSCAQCAYVPASANPSCLVMPPAVLHQLQYCWHTKDCDTLLSACVICPAGGQPDHVCSSFGQVTDCDLQLMRKQRHYAHQTWLASVMFTLQADNSTQRMQEEIKTVWRTGARIWTHSHTWRCCRTSNSACTRLINQH